MSYYTPFILGGTKAQRGEMTFVANTCGMYYVTHDMTHLFLTIIFSKFGLWTSNISMT